jgi:hypothetical protein
MSFFVDLHGVSTYISSGHQSNNWCSIPAVLLASVTMLQPCASHASLHAQVLPAIGRYDYNPALAIWLVTLAFITYMCAIVALPRDFVLVATLIVLATGSVLGAIGFFAALEIIIKIAAYFCEWLMHTGGCGGIYTCPMAKDITCYCQLDTEHKSLTSVWLMPGNVSGRLVLRVVWFLSSRVGSIW